MNTEGRVLSIARFHARAWARRLDQIGGPGVGGTELAYYPSRTKHAETEEESTRMALELSIPFTWEEAAWSYVFGNFRAATILAATILEIALRYELVCREHSGRSTLGRLIADARSEGIIDDAQVKVAQRINARRTDIAHSNIQRERPESFLSYSGDEHEHEDLSEQAAIAEDGTFRLDGTTLNISFQSTGPSYARVGPFGRAAIHSLSELRDMLRQLYPITESTSGEGP